MEFFVYIGDLLVREPLSAAVLVIFTLQILHALNQKRDDQNISGAITLAGAVVATFEPLRLSIETMAANEQARHDRLIGGIGETQTLISAAAQENRLAHQIQLDTLSKADGRFDSLESMGNEHHAVIMARMAGQNAQIENLIKEIRAAQIPEEIRGGITKLILLVTCVSQDVKSILNKRQGESEPGEVPADQALTEREA